VSASGKFEMVARAQLATVLKEQRNCRKDIYAKECRLEVGRLVSAQKMVTARLIALRYRSYMLSVVLTDLERGTMKEVDGACKRCGTWELLAHVERTVNRLLGSSPPPPPPPPPPRSGLRWVRIRGGGFWMGSPRGSSGERPVHRVRVAGFRMGRSEVTVAQYLRCVKSGTCTRPHWDDGTCKVATGRRWRKGVLPASFRGRSQPVVCVDWSQARAFCRWAGGRLPSEAEWEYAARSRGMNRRYPWGNAGPSCGRVVMDHRGLGCGRGRTWPVCSKPAGNTAQGLCDMAGNVWEWLEDRSHADYRGAPSTSRAWTEGTDFRRVLRGGSWNRAANTLRAANRASFKPSFNSDFYGFRCARSGR